MAPASILYNDSRTRTGATVAAEPAFFMDLNLDQVVADLVVGRAGYCLEDFYRIPLKDVATIRYRQQVFQDLERGNLRERMGVFADEMSRLRKRLAQAAELRYPYQRERWLLDAAAAYCDAVTTLASDLDNADLRSPALQGMRRFITDYTTGDGFGVIRTDTHRCRTDLAGVQYCLQIYGNRIQVTPYDGQSDYGASVLETFARFKQGAVKDYRVQFRRYPAMNHVEAGVLDLVAEIYPEEFAALDRFCSDHQDFLHPTIAAFDRELQFYLAYLDYTEPMRQAGLAFCYPDVEERCTDVRAVATFDLALARKLSIAHEGEALVCNDFALSRPERIIVVSGPNNGGKTTFARTFGQLHYLAELGVPVPGRAARLSLCDQLFTHFERSESPEKLRGKLQDDLVRIHAILDAATGGSIVILNELFTSTSLQDAVFLGTAIVRRIVELDLLCVYVTFVDELSTLGETTISMVSTVKPEDPTTRTYKIIRRPADGHAYAVAIAERFGLTYGRLKERLAS